MSDIFFKAFWCLALILPTPYLGADIYVWLVSRVGREVFWWKEKIKIALNYYDMITIHFAQW